MAYIPKSKIKKSTTLGGVFLTKKEKTNYKEIILKQVMVYIMQVIII